MVYTLLVGEAIDEVFAIMDTRKAEKKEDETRKNKIETM